MPATMYERGPQQTWMCVSSIGLESECGPNTYRRDRLHAEDERILRHVAGIRESILFPHLTEQCL